MANYAIETTALCVSRGDRQVLDQIDVGVRAGMVTGLLGPSGCGKTTLIRTIAGTQLIGRGDVRVLGRPAGDPRCQRVLLRRAGRIVLAGTPADLRDRTGHADLGEAFLALIREAAAA